MMRKSAGFSLLELFITISLMGVMAVMAAPSFRQWREHQRIEVDFQNPLSLLADVRAMALADKECVEKTAARWIARFEEGETSLLCTYTEDTGEESEPTLISSFPWESTATISFWQTDDIFYFDDTDAETASLEISIFPGGTQSQIGNEYSNQWARIDIESEDTTKRRRVCFSRIATYPFISSFETTYPCEDN